MSVTFMRPVRESDLDEIHAFAMKSGGGMTNLPADRDTLGRKIAFSLESYGKGATKPDGESYMLVLEREGAVVGTAGVFASIGAHQGFVNYKINREFYFSVSLQKRFRRDVLVPTHDFTDCGEVGQLFIAPAARGLGLGTLLSRARYMFIAQSPELIADPVCAEMRGWRSADGGQPFWNAVGRRFFGMSFEEADAYNAAYGNQFIEDLMPRYPIYVDMLPEDARRCIGRAHDGAGAAYKMLTEEGFKFNDYIDVFDGGPLVDACKGDIRTVRDSVVLKVAAIGAVEDGAPTLMASGAVGTFRCVREKARMEGGGVTISAAAGEALGAGVGDFLRCAE